MNIASIVITYFPSNDFFENIKSYLPYCNKLIIADNSEPNISFPNEIMNDGKIEIIHDGENKGIAYQLNKAAEIALQQGFSWLLTMDQDSFFDKKNIENYLNYANDFGDKEKVAMFGIETNFKPDTINNNYVKTSFLITSGSILNLKLFKKIGGFDEELFIDGVDDEYCFHAIQKGFEIIKFYNIFLQHKLGESEQHTSLKNLKTTSRTFHSPLRLYYMMRNFLYISKKYKKQFPQEIRYKKIDLFHRIKNQLLYKKEKLQVINMMLKAYADFKKNNTGKFKQ